MPSFSIITPSLNQPEWLQLGVASVADQVPEPHAPLTIEHIIQEGGTADLTEIEARFSQTPRRDYKLRIFRESDSGMYDAINRGLTKATGEILAYLNCDEQYLPGTLRKVGAFFERHPDIDLVFGDAVVTDASLIPLAYRRVVPPLRWHTLLRPLGVLTCSTFFRRKLVEDGVRFDPSWKIIGDKAWLLEVLNRGYGMGILPEPLAIFALTGANLSQHPGRAEERDRWERGIPLGLRGLRPFVQLHHGWRKWRAGAYDGFRGDLSYYQWHDIFRRTNLADLTLGCAWPQPQTLSPASQP